MSRFMRFAASSARRTFRRVSSASQIGTRMLAAGRGFSRNLTQYKAPLTAAAAMGAGIVGCVGLTAVAEALEPKAELVSFNAPGKDSVNIVLHTEEQPTLDDMKIFSGTANLPLASEIAEELGVPLGELSIKAYADGEIGIQVHENVRGKDIYIIQPTCPPGVNDNLMELILLVSTMRRASARKITAVIPYFGYARQDRKMQSRVPISAADVCRLLEAMGVDRVVAVDLHCGQIQGFFGPRTPCDNLEGSVVALPYFANLDLKSESTIVASPDAGGVHRAKHFRDRLKKRYGIDAGLAMIIKQRLRANAVERMDLVGNVEGCDVILVDDMIDTAGTLTKAASELTARGAKRVFAYATHGLFNGPAVSRIQKSELEQVVICNTVPLSPAAVQCSKIKQLSIAELLAEAIARIHYRKSVSVLFKK
eukprot:CAMPEP_0114512446 /NCGR_PEP_ID=MMETSP0109-20121206/14979_1 /TAXON_ID=29199 /ORGANISM="Chlorarachnion reptans, Strain CCCM449" /LENGTH=422 /DNA_ID=CAMNT_0001692129 /DNA_START=9 /DNA_END=1277 /DNA_ORIENTATION=+